MYGFKVLSDQPHERIKPLYDSGELKNDEVYVVAQAYMLLLMRQYETAVIGIVVVAHHNVMEEAERTCGIIGEDNDIAFVVGDMLASAQTQHQRHSLYRCQG